MRSSNSSATTATPNAKTSTWKRAPHIAARLAGTCAAVYLFYWVVVGVLATSHRYQPPVSALNIEGNCDPAKWPQTLRLLTWNVGYAGTGAEDDFFLAGGRNVFAKDKPSVLRHLANINAFLRQIPADLYLIEEVDSPSRRTYGVNERQVIASGMDACCSSYALNHNVYFIPYPKLKPLGKVQSGMLALGRCRPADAKRVQLQGVFPWPDRAFQMERCLLVWKLPRQDGKNWTIIQLHLEAWDAGNIRKAELAQLRELALQEYNEGNYVVLGGDWNAVLPGLRLDEFTARPPAANTILLDPDFLPTGWTWGVDRSRPTNRSVDSPYDPQRNYFTAIDGFVVSPNVHIDSVRTIPLNFQDSDHEPVQIEVVSRASL